MPSAEYQREWRLKNPHKQVAYLKKYRETHRDEIRIRSKRAYFSRDGKGKSRLWRLANPEKVKAAKAKYRAKATTLPKERAYGRRWRVSNIPRLLLRQARMRAKNLDMPFALTLSDVVIPANCPVLGMKLMCGKGKLTAASPTLDRIDNSLGYVPGNVMVISYKANTMKNSASFDELRRFVAFYDGFLRQRREVA